MKKLYIFFVLAFAVCSINAQTHELVYWTGENTATYSYPQAGIGLASQITAASQNYNGLVGKNDSRNIWVNPNDSSAVDINTAPYLEFQLTLDTTALIDL